MQVIQYYLNNIKENLSSHKCNVRELEADVKTLRTRNYVLTASQVLMIRQVIKLNLNEKLICVFSDLSHLK